MIKTKVSSYKYRFGILVAILLLLLLIDCSYGLQCYKCDVTPERSDANSSVQICSQFDESSKFITECPYSTMCVKRIARLEIHHGQIIETITRDCANQKFTKKVYKQKKWTDEYKVVEVYNEGCKEHEENKLSASTVTYCHCRGNLCNTAPSKDPNGYHTDAMAVIFIFNVVKYLRGPTLY